MKLIVNGDDFGYSVGQNLGILECFKNGIMTSTTLMVNMSGFDHAVELMKTNKELNVGIHLVMTVGKPVSKGLKTIVNKDGVFDRDISKIDNGDIEEIREEYKAQIDKFLATGFIPTHIDFHYYASKKQYEVAMEFAKELNIPMRAMDNSFEELLSKNKVRYCKNHNTEFYDGGVTLDNLISILDKNKSNDYMELMCHPAYVDSTILKNSSYNTKRAFELELLTSNEIKNYIKNNNIELINFKSL